MSAEVANLCERIVTAYRRGQTLVVLFDYDGTLAPITSHPSMAVLTPELRDLLIRLAAIPRVAVGVVSGRSLADVSRLVGLPGLYYAGSSGMQLDLRGQLVQHPNELEASRLVATVVDPLRVVLSDFVGAWIEGKPAALTVHYRDVAADRHAGLLAAITVCLTPWAAQLITNSGPMSIEITPRNGWNKGTAVLMIVDRVGRHTAFPIFIGDEANDADAFAVVSALGGVSIGIGLHAPSNATHRLRDPSEVAELLRAVLVA